MIQEFPVIDTVVMMMMMMMIFLDINLLILYYFGCLSLFLFTLGRSVLSLIPNGGKHTGRTTRTTQHTTTALNHEV